MKDIPKQKKDKKVNPRIKQSKTTKQAERIK